MTHSHTRRNAHVPRWQLRQPPRRPMPATCNHRCGWDAHTLDAGLVQEVCRRCGATRQVRA